MDRPGHGLTDRSRSGCQPCSARRNRRRLGLVASLTQFAVRSAPRDLPRRRWAFDRLFARSAGQRLERVAMSRQPLGVCGLTHQPCRGLPHRQVRQLLHGITGTHYGIHRVDAPRRASPGPPHRSQGLAVPAARFSHLISHHRYVESGPTKCQRTSISIPDRGRIRHA